MFLFSKEAKGKKESMVFHHRSIKVSKKRVRMIVKGDTSSIAIRGLKISNACIHVYTLAYTCTQVHTDVRI